MKKLLTLFIALFITASLYAQDEGGTSEVGNRKSESAFLEDDKTIQAGFSFGTYGWGYGSRSVSIPALNAALEFGVHEAISVGPFFGIARWSWDPGFLGAGDRYTYTETAFGGRGTFHYVPIANEALDLGIDEAKFDFYVTLFVGYLMESTNLTNEPNNFDTASRFLFNPVLGFEYMLSPSLGIYFEGGNGTFGYGTIGLSARF